MIALNNDARTFISAAIGALAIAAGAQIRVPMVPVPMTLQTLALFLAAGLGGRRVAVAAAGAYLAAVLLGAPILSGWIAAPALRFFALRSAGYVLGFLPAAALVGSLLVLPRRSWLHDLLAFLAGHGVVLLCGAAWLAASVGSGAALRAQAPLLLAAVLKSTVAAGALWVARQSALGKKIRVRSENLSGLR